jgi:hypothetical protein
LRNIGAIEETLHYAIAPPTVEVTRRWRASNSVRLPTQCKALFESATGLTGQHRYRTSEASYLLTKPTRAGDGRCGQR